MTRRGQWLLFGAIVVAIGAAVGITMYGLRDEMFPVDVGAKAPNFEAVTLNDHVVKSLHDDYKGQVVLVNLWATWCAPCVKELPTLDKLAAAHRDDGKLGVVTVSQDSGPQPSVEAFLAKLNAKDLGAYHDPKMALSGALGPDTVLPTSILYDAQGREVWRYVGDLDWTSPEAAKLLSEAGAPAKG